MGREKDQWMLPGVSPDGCVRLSCQSAAGGTGREFSAEQLLLCIAEVAGEQDMTLVGKQQHGAVSECMTRCMHQNEVVREQAGILKRAEGSIQRKQVRLEPGGKEFG